MTTVATSTLSPDLVRLGVSWSGDRSELVLPARIPLGELVPAVAAAVGALDPEEVHRGCVLLADDGRVLDPETGLRQQGVRDGETVTLVLGLGSEAGADDDVHDDLVDAVTAALVVVSPGWGAEDSRTSSRVLGGLCLAAGALVLGLHHTSGPVVATAAAILSVLLLAAGTIAAQRQATEIADLLLLAAGPYAAVAGLAVAAGDAARAVLLGGLALALTGGAAVALEGAVARSSGTPSTADATRAADATRSARRLATLLVPWFVGGTFAALVGATVAVTSLPVEPVVAVELVSLVVLGAAVPRILVSRSRPARRLALGGVLGVDLVLAASAPVVVTGGGWAGLGLVGVCGLLQAGRTRAMIPDVGGSLLTALAVGSSLAGPVAASVTALFQPPSLLLPPTPFLPPGLHDADAWGAVPVWLTAATMVLAIAAAVAASLLIFLRAGRRQPSAGWDPSGLQTLDHVNLLEGAAVALLVVLLVVSVGLVSPVGAS